MRTTLIVAILVMMSMAVHSSENMESIMIEEAPIYGFNFNTITGEETSLKSFEGKVLLVVNVASKCGFTKQYAGLQELYEKYQDKGLVIVGFPANNFGGQEPGSNEEIMEFCSTKFDVTFPMMAKISVKGDDIHPLYKYLTTHSEKKEEISWNFNKFLIGRDGHIIKHFGTRTKPDDSKILAAIEEAL
ncbi:glutathione peroxidase [bacterium]|nr:glutathione peroxidase [bacterium]